MKVPPLVASAPVNVPVPPVRPGDPVGRLQSSAAALAGAAGSAPNIDAAVTVPAANVRLLAVASMVNRHTIAAVVGQAVPPSNNGALALAVLPVSTTSTLRRSARPSVNFLCVTVSRRLMPARGQRAMMPLAYNPAVPRRSTIPIPPDVAATSVFTPVPTSVKLANIGVLFGVELYPSVQPEPDADPQPSISKPCGSVD